jgi:hypothetical protein
MSPLPVAGEFTPKLKSTNHKIYYNEMNYSWKEKAWDKQKGEGGKEVEMVKSHRNKMREMSDVRIYF